MTKLKSIEIKTLSKKIKKNLEEKEFFFSEREIRKIISELEKEIKKEVISGNIFTISKFVKIFLVKRPQTEIYSYKEDKKVTIPPRILPRAKFSDIFKKELRKFDEPIN